MVGRCSNAELDFVVLKYMGNEVERLRIKRYILGFASTGSGHYYALLALASEIRLAEPCSRIEVLDVLGAKTSFGSRLIRGAWGAMSTVWFLRPLYRALYRLLLGNTSTSSLIAWLTTFFAKYNFAKSPLQVDHFIALHSAAIPCGLALKRRTGCRLSVVATDYVFHNLHCHSEVDEYFVPVCCTTLGRKPSEAIRSGRVRYRAIPIDSRFLNGFYARPPIDGNDFRVLVSFGAAGLRGIHSVRLISCLLRSTSETVKYTLVAGNDHKLYREFLSIQATDLGRLRVSVFGLVENMADLMRSSHILVGKSGGLTVTEARHVGLPIAIVDALPGQEEFNRDLVVSEKSGISVNDPSLLIRFISQLREPSEWLRWSNAARSSGAAAYAVTSITAPELKSDRRAGNSLGGTRGSRRSGLSTVPRAPVLLDR